MLHHVTYRVVSVCCATIQTVLTGTFRYGTEVTELVRVVGKGNLMIQVFGGLALYRGTDQRQTHYMDNTHPVTLCHIPVVLNHQQC
jgi:hypothetical protein